MSRLEEEVELNQTCIWMNNKTNEYWKLVWQDQFDSEIENRWTVEHEENECYGNHDLKQLSCNTKRNIELKNGFLILAAKHEPYYQYQYTGAAMVTKRAFRKGRYEVRASLPVGKQIHLCINTVNDKARYWHENGEIHLVCTTNKKSDIQRGVYYANSSSSDDYVNKDVQLYKDLHEFHVYGVEWNEEGLQFFFDEVYSGLIEFNESHGVLPNHQLRIQLGVGSQYFSEDFPGDFDLLYWVCPALMIDYIYVYELATKDEISLYEECENLIPGTQEQKNIDSICKQLMSSMHVPLIKKIRAVWKETSIGILLLLVLILANLYYCNRIKTSRMSNKARALEMRLQKRNQEYGIECYDTPYEYGYTQQASFEYTDDEYLRIVQAEEQYKRVYLDMQPSTNTVI